MKLKGSPE